MEWIALILSLVGILLNAAKIIYCWPVWLLSDIAWGIYARKKKLSALFYLQFLFGLANIWGWWMWSKQ